MIIMQVLPRHYMPNVSWLTTLTIVSINSQNTFTYSVYFRTQLRWIRRSECTRRAAPSISIEFSSSSLTYAIHMNLSLGNMIISLYFIFMKRMSAKNNIF